MRRTLYLIPLKGVVHGSSVVAQAFRRYIISSDDITISIQLSDSSKSMGKYNLRKLYNVLTMLWRVMLVRNKVDNYVLFYTASKPLIYRDLLFKIILLKKQGIFVMHNKGFRDLKLPLFIKNYFFRQSKLILLSKKLIYDVEQFVDRSQIKIIPNCLFDEKLSNVDPKNFSQLNFLFLSNLIESKGVVESIRVINELISNGMNVTLDIIGKEIDVFSSDLDELIGENRNRIRYHGAIYGNEKSAFFKKCNILIFPTRYSMECFPLVILESFAHGIPVISTFNGAISDIITDGSNGLLFHDFYSKNGLKRICDKIQSINEREWGRLSASALNTISEKYLLNNWIEDYKAVIKN